VDTLAEVLAEVRKIEIRARGMVREEFGGEYHSSFKGQGIDFKDLREYIHGDEVRSIDWNTTARTGAPYVKQFVEERELTVYLAVDISGSGTYGSLHHSKRRVAANAAAVFAFSAVQNGDKVGLVLFGEGVEYYLPPRKGSSHALRIVREILFREAETPGSNPAAALDFLLDRHHRHALVLLISDFLCENSLDRPLAVAAKKHDLVAIQVSDPAEVELPRAGRVRLRDPETGVQQVINTNNSSVRESYSSHRKAWQEKLDTSLRRAGVDKIELSTDPKASLGPALHAFFKRRGGTA
jgi:uncharacterized protein (DUF58 family)